ncbi:MAG: hypothetical protein EAX87_01320 [Candidatus Thorarchaeota archaeon]|nr:hypothetical protein [Candidatus Thorarchaeota archaeon]
MTAVDDEKITEEEESESSIGTSLERATTDVVRVLEGAGHRTAEYPNGLVLGVRLVGIPGTRGVYVDVAYVLDLKKARFGRSTLAMQAAILESVNGSLKSILKDVGLLDAFEARSLLSSFGRVEFSVMRSIDSKSSSLIHETRTIYAVYKEGSSRRDLSWLTDSSRILPDNELGLLLSSDSRSHLHDVQKNVSSTKWDDLETGLRRSWLGILCIVMGVMAGFGIAGALLNNGTLIFPLVVFCISFLLGSWMLQGANTAIGSFRSALNEEVSALSEVGDSNRVTSSIMENANRLELVGTLNFIVTPLMDSAAESIETGDFNKSVGSLFTILDECVRLTPTSTVEMPNLSGDPGLEKFLSLFKNIGLEFGEGEEEALGLAYVGLTGHSSTPLKEHEIIGHLGVLNNALFDVGALSPEVKNRIDDILNLHASKKIVMEIDKDLAEPEEPPVREEMAPASAESEDELDSFLQVMGNTEEVPGANDRVIKEPDRTRKEFADPPMVVAKTVDEEPAESVQVLLAAEDETSEQVVKRSKLQRHSVTSSSSRTHFPTRKKERGSTGG